MARLGDGDEACTMEHHGDSSHPVGAQNDKGEGASSGVMPRARGARGIPAARRKRGWAIGRGPGHLDRVSSPHLEEHRCQLLPVLSGERILIPQDGEDRQKNLARQAVPIALILPQNVQ